MIEHTLKVPCLFSPPTQIFWLVIFFVEFLPLPKNLHFILMSSNKIKWENLRDSLHFSKFQIDTSVDLRTFGRFSSSFPEHLSFLIVLPQPATLQISPSTTRYIYVTYVSIGRNKGSESKEICHLRSGLLRFGIWEWDFWDSDFWDSDF